jgi:O-antigen/teichoic acid export membrane protein
MHDTIQKKAFKGVFWSAIERISSLGIQFLITIIIARALSPYDYGLVGMLSIFTALGTVILDSGFSQALIRKNDADQEDYSSVFFLNLLLGVVIYTCLYFSAPLIADFYNSPELTKIARLVFLVFPLNSLGLIQYTIVNKQVNFKRLAKVTVLSALLSGIIGVIMAYAGYGVWTLVVQSISIVAFKSLFLWVFNNWRPSLCFSIKSIKNIFNFSVNLLITDIITVLFNNIYTLIIGKVYPIAQVGYYNQSKLFVDTPSQTLTSIIQRVSYPILSTIQDNDEQLTAGYRKVVDLTMYLNFPLMFGLLAAGNNLFSLLLTDKWLPSVPYFQILCIYGAIFPLHSINVNILKVKAKGGLLLKLEIVRRLLLVVAIIFTLYHGVLYLLIGMVISAITSILINMYFCGKEINLSLYLQLKNISMCFLASIATAILMLVVGSLLGISLISLLTQLFVGFSAYYILSVICKLKSYNDIKCLCTNYLIQKKNE